MQSVYFVVSVEKVPSSLSALIILPTGFRTLNTQTCVGRQSSYKSMMWSDLLLLGAPVSLGLEEVYELGLLGDGPLHFHLLMGVHSLQVELSEHHYCHECLLKYFSSHRENGDVQYAEFMCLSLLTPCDTTVKTDDTSPTALISDVCVAAPGCSPAGTPGPSSQSSAGRSGPERPAAPGSDGRCGSSGRPSAAAASLAVEVKQLLHHQLGL